MDDPILVGLLTVLSTVTAITALVAVVAPRRLTTRPTRLESLRVQFISLAIVSCLVLAALWENVWRWEPSG